jgi:hypothetical protein
MLQDPYPDIELALPPLAQPLRRPSLVPTMEEGDDDCQPLARSTPGLSCSSASTVSRKRESYNLSGSIFLVTSSGRVLNLPVPSESPADPLNWGRWKTVGAITAVAWYSIVSLTVVQAASMLYHGIMADFGGEVCVLERDSSSFTDQRLQRIFIHGRWKH